jgi:hypothetical protein
MKYLLTIIYILVLPGCTNNSLISKNNIYSNKEIDVSNVDLDTETRKDNTSINSKQVEDIQALPDLPSGKLAENNSLDNLYSFSASFLGEKIIEESGDITESLDPDWSVSSGAYVFFKNGIGTTIQGELSEDDRWYKIYRNTNFEDTDGGQHPQNIFRLVLLKKFLNLSQENYFRIRDDHLSKSQYRNGSNGLLFFNRYQSSQTLYYTGLRVDGGVTIKKKKNGVYYTLKTKNIFPGVYDREYNPNLLTKNIWIGLKSEVVDRVDGGVDIKVYLDINKTGEWELICEAIDDGKSFGGEVLSEAGLAGIRTDFMDVEFDNYKIKELKLK